MLRRDATGTARFYPRGCVPDIGRTSCFASRAYEVTAPALEGEGARAGPFLVQRDAVRQ
jgi:hypothetical protein